MVISNGAALPCGGSCAATSLEMLMRPATPASSEIFDAMFTGLPAIPLGPRGFEKVQHRPARHADLDREAVRGEPPAQRVRGVEGFGRPVKGQDA